MGALYPGDIRDDWTTHIDIQDTVFAVHVNDLQDEMKATQTELGVSPKGGFASVKARLDDLAANKSATTHNHDGYHLRNVDHDVTARHTFGAALGTPGAPSSIALGAAAAAGAGTVPARSDHTHGAPSAAVVADAVLPAGVIVGYGGGTAPTGWFLCQGQSLNRATYPALFSAIGVSYGEGSNPGTTFAIPDLRQRFPLGKAASGTGSTIGGTGGSKDALLVSHSHTVNSHSHPGSSISGGSHNHSASSNTSGSTHSHAVPDTKTSSSTTHTHIASANPAWVASDPSPVSGDTFDATTNSSGSHTHGITVNTDTSHSHTNSVASEAPGTNSQGSSATDGRLPPYQVVNYIIKAA